MYVERIPALQSRICTFQEKTLKQEITWCVPMPVPTARRSTWYDFYFTLGDFVETDGSTLAVFRKNQRRNTDLRDPQSYMLIHAPFGNAEDLVVIFHTLLNESEGGMLVGKITVIKGILPDLPGHAEEALLFNLAINRELRRLFLLGSQAAQESQLMRTQLELMEIDDAPIEPGWRS